MKTTSVELLPEEIWVEILMFLEPQEVLHLALASKYFHRVCTDELVWHRIFYSQFPKTITLREEDNISWRKEYFWRANASNRVLYFNNHPIKCIKGMMRDGIIVNPQGLAVFLKNTRISISKKQEILLMKESEIFDNESKNDEQEGDNIIINEIEENGIENNNNSKDKEKNEIILLNYYLETFEFRNKSLAKALREFIFDFGMPRSQRGIKKSATLFSQYYFNVNCNLNNPEFYFQNDNDVYILTYAIIMLNTDAHNPKVKEKMTPDRFIDTMITLLAGGNFPREALYNVYLDIQAKEIREPFYSDKIGRLEDSQKKYSKALREVAPEFLSKPVIKIGYLKMNEKTLIMERMKKKFFVLTKDYLFAYSSKPNLNANAPLPIPNFALPLNVHTKISTKFISSEPENVYSDLKEKKNYFSIITNDVNYSLAAATDADARDWLQTILEILEQYETDNDLNYKIFSSEDKEEKADP